MSSVATNNEADILSRIIVPERPSLSPDAARSILALEFSQQDRNRMHESAQKAQEGVLTPHERSELDGYERAGCLLGILQSKARSSLNKSAPSE